MTVHLNPARHLRLNVGCGLGLPMLVLLVGLAACSGAPKPGGAVVSQPVVVTGASGSPPPPAAPAIADTRMSPTTSAKVLPVPQPPANSGSVARKPSGPSRSTMAAPVAAAPPSSVAPKAPAASVAAATPTTSPLPATRPKKATVPGTGQVTCRSQKTGQATYEKVAISCTNTSSVPQTVFIQVNGVGVSGIPNSARQQVGYAIAPGESRRLIDLKVISRPYTADFAYTAKPLPEFKVPG